MFSPPQASRKVLFPCTFSFNSFGYLGFSEFTHSPGGRCLQLHPLQRVCKKPQCPRSVQQGPRCILFIIHGLAPHGFSCRLTDGACCGYAGWMKHSPRKTQGRAHLPVCTRSSLTSRSPGWLYKLLHPFYCWISSSLVPWMVVQFPCIPSGIPEITSILPCYLSSSGGKSAHSEWAVHSLIDLKAT